MLEMTFCILEGPVKDAMDTGVKPHYGQLVLY